MTGIRQQHGAPARGRPIRWPIRCPVTVFFTALGSVLAACDQTEKDKPNEKFSATVESPQQPKTLLIKVTGHDFQWHSRYPGPDGRFNTDDDVLAAAELHCPLDRQLEIELNSKDYVYRFALPEFDMEEIAVPDMTFTVRFIPDAAGTFEITGDLICGYEHDSLLGQLIIEPTGQFDTWIAQARLNRLDPPNR